jgi:hypothetical protein
MNPYLEKQQEAELAALQVVVDDLHWLQPEGVSAFGSPSSGSGARAARSVRQQQGDAALRRQLDSLQRTHAKREAQLDVLRAEHGRLVAAAALPEASAAQCHISRLETEVRSAELSAVEAIHYVPTLERMHERTLLANAQLKASHRTCNGATCPAAGRRCRPLPSLFHPRLRAAAF